MNDILSKVVIFYAIVLWIFKLVIAVCAQVGVEFLGIVSFNNTYEIILLFINLLALVLIANRKLFGGILYLIVNGVYHGIYLVSNINGNVQLSGTDIVSLVAIVIAVIIMIQQLYAKKLEISPADKKREWFYGDEKYDRIKDERADKNNYKTL